MVDMGFVYTHELIFMSTVIKLMKLAMMQVITLICDGEFMRNED